MSRPYLIQTDIHLNGTLDELHESVCAKVEEKFSLKGSVVPQVTIDEGLHWISFATPAGSDQNDEQDDKDDAWDIAHWLSSVMHLTHARFCSQVSIAADDITFVITVGRNGEWRISRWMATIARSGLNYLGPRIDEPNEELADIATDLWNLFNRGRSANDVAEPDRSVA